MKNVQESFLPTEEKEASKGNKKGKSKTVRFSHITLTRNGTQGIPSTKVQSITYANMYQQCFDFTKLSSRTFMYDDESFTITFYDNDEQYACFSLCNSKNFNEQLVTAINRKTNQQVSEDLELQYYSFVCIDKHTNKLAYIFNKNIKDVNKLLQTYLYQYEHCVVVPLEMTDIKKRISAAHKLGSLSFWLDASAKDETNKLLNGIFQWDKELVNYKVNVKISATKALMHEVLNGTELVMNATKPKLEIYDDPRSNKQIIDLFRDKFTLYISIPSDSIRMDRVNEIFLILKESFAHATTDTLIQ